VFASLTALLIGLLIGPFVIERLRNSRSGSTFVKKGRRAIRKKVERRRWWSADLYQRAGADSVVERPDEPFCVAGDFSMLAFAAIGFATTTSRLCTNGTLDCLAAEINFQFVPAPRLRLCC